MNFYRVTYRMTTRRGVVRDQVVVEASDPDSAAESVRLNVLAAMQSRGVTDPVADFEDYFRVVGVILVPDPRVHPEMAGA